MMPQLVTLHRSRRGRRLRLYVPVLPVVLVLSPVLLLAVLAGLVVCVFFRMRPVGALCGAGRLLWALPGTRFELAYGASAVLVSVR